MTGVSSTHPHYDDMSARWSLVRDVVDSKVDKYILDVDPNDKIRNLRYKTDARFTNFTSRTRNGLVGAVFRKPIQVDLPESISYLQEDATGSKLTLAKLSQEVLGEVLQSGRYGLLVDFPASEEGLTAAEVTNLNLKARINPYKPETIINWNTEVVNGQSVLSLVVLQESVSKLGEDGFTWESETQYRVLRMVEGVYVQQIYNEAEELVYEYVPRDFSGSSWDHIPFVFVGAEDNDPIIDSAPLYDLAQLNIGHLRNSADYEESVHICGQPTLIISTEMTMEEFSSFNPNGVLLGARKGHNLGPNGNAFLLQAAPNQLADVAMQRKEEQAVMIGARLIMAAGTNETAEAARMRHSGENSVLALVTDNVNAALEQCLAWCMRFMSNEDPTDAFVFEINRDFFDAALDPNAIIAQLQLMTSGVIAANDVRYSLRKAGLLDPARTDDDIEAEVDQINPLSLGGPIQEPEQPGEEE